MSYKTAIHLNGYFSLSLSVHSLQREYHIVYSHTPDITEET